MHQSNSVVRVIDFPEPEIIGPLKGHEAVVTTSPAMQVRAPADLLLPPGFEERIASQDRVIPAAWLHGTIALLYAGKDIDAIKAILVSELAIDDVVWGRILSAPSVQEARVNSRMQFIEASRDKLVRTLPAQIDGLINLADSTEDERLELDTRSRLISIADKVLVDQRALPTISNVPQPAVNVQVNQAANQSWEDRVRDRSVSNPASPNNELITINVRSG